MRSRAMGLPTMKRVGRRILPAAIQNEIYRIRTLGLRKYVYYTRLEQHERRKPRPAANQPFDIGAPVPIVLHETTVAAVSTHWVTAGHPIRELKAFKAVAGAHTCFVDIGAAEGIFSAAFCALTGRTAWAFEPSPEMFGRLNQLRDLNPTFDIRPHSFALGTRPGTQAVRAFGDGQFSGVADVDASTPTIEMAVATLDDVARDFGFAPDFAKIDVEGMELEVFRGGTATFRERVRTVMLEVHGSTLFGGESPRDVQRVLDDLGFDLFDLDLKPVPDLERYMRAEPELISGYTIIVCRKRTA